MHFGRAAGAPALPSAEAASGAGRARVDVVVGDIRQRRCVRRWVHLGPKDVVVLEDLRHRHQSRRPGHPDARSHRQLEAIFLVGLDRVPDEADGFAYQMVAQAHQDFGCGHAGVDIMLVRLRA